MLPELERLYKDQDPIAADQECLIGLIKAFHKTPSRLLSEWPLQEVLPTAERLERSPDTLFCELFGEPKSGKSSLLKWLKIDAADKLSGVRLNLVPEFSSMAAEYEEIKAKGWEQYKKGPFLDSMKLGNFFEAVGAEIEQTKYSGKVVTICERGTSDVLASEILWKQIMMKSLTPDHEDDLFTFLHDLLSCPSPWEKMVSLHITAARASFYLKAVILYRVPFEEALARRGGEEGNLINRKNWPAFETAYSWWLEYIYPELREKYGTGLLIVDGARPLEENNQRVLNYLLKILSLSQ